MSNNTLRNPGRSELICKLYESGKSIKMVADILSLSTSTVEYYLRRNNVTMRPPCRIANKKSRYVPHPRKNKVDGEELRKLIAQRKTLVEIAEYFGCHTSTVSYHMYKHGLSIRNVTNEEVAKMREFRELGLTNAQIALRMGRSYATIQSHIGCQPSEITKNSTFYRAELCKLKNKRCVAARALMQQKRIDEARLEAERKAAEEAARREEEARVAAETSIREILVACGLPSEIHIESSAQGNTILANMQNQFAAATAAA